MVSPEFYPGTLNSPWYCCSLQSPIDSRIIVIYDCKLVTGAFVLLYWKDMNVLKVSESFRIESRTVRYTLYTLFCVIVADGLITEFLVTGGHGSEVNPFLSAWVGHGWFLAIKVSGAFLATLLLWINYNVKPRLVYTITVVFLAFYTSIVFWNLSVLLFTA